MQIDPLFDVNSEVVVLTGVSGQLGHEFANAFLARGAKVAGIDIHTTDSVAALQSKFADTFSYYMTDICDKPALRAAADDIVQRHGRISVLVNNAALDSPPDAGEDEAGPFENYPEASWDKVIGVNLKGTFLCCQVFGSLMAEGGGGSIINIASIYGTVSPDQSLYEFKRRNGEEFYKPVAYSASKSGIYNLTRYLATYWAKKKVRVNSLTPGGVFNNQPEEFLEAYCGRIPIGRMAEPNEYSGAVIFLASRASSYMTGANLVIDGGWTAI
jgi:NAD(P)-dependent dehydrogenase (short-subunit alcohol dehydrogenase family)